MTGAAMAEPSRGLPAAPSTEGLPRAFLQSLRTLFDILDDRRRGYVHLREIESRWQDADASELPRGVLEGLRQVAPASGYLTFERFVSGLRTSLLSADGGPRGPARAPARAGGPTRTGSQPPPPQRLVFAPADEPRTVLERKPLPLGARPPAAGPGGAARSLETLCGPAEAAPGLAEPERPQGAALERSPSADSGAVACRAWELGVGNARRAPRARGERRRHTITNGVDCDLLEQVTQLEQEQEVLLQGLRVMTRGRDWCLQQLQHVQERQRLGQSKTSADFGAEGSPPALGRLLPKVQEVARCLGELLAAACAGRALPSSSSGPLGPTLDPSWQQQTILMLKEQNRLLTQVLQMQPVTFPELKSASSSAPNPSMNPSLRADRDPKHCGAAAQSASHLGFAALFCLEPPPLLHLARSCPALQMDRLKGPKMPEHSLWAGVRPRLWALRSPHTPRTWKAGVRQVCPHLPRKTFHMTLTLRCRDNPVTKGSSGIAASLGPGVPCRVTNGCLGGPTGLKGRISSVPRLAGPGDWKKQTP